MTDLNFASGKAPLGKRLTTFLVFALLVNMGFATSDFSASQDQSVIAPRSQVEELNRMYQLINNAGKTSVVLDISDSRGRLLTIQQRLDNLSPAEKKSESFETIKRLVARIRLQKIPYQVADINGVEYVYVQDKEVDGGSAYVIRTTNKDQDRLKKWLPVPIIKNDYIEAFDVTDKTFMREIFYHAYEKDLFEEYFPQEEVGSISSKELDNLIQNIEFFERIMGKRELKERIRQEQDFLVSSRVFKEGEVRPLDVLLGLVDRSEDAEKRFAEKKRGPPWMLFMMGGGEQGTTLVSQYMKLLKGRSASYENPYLPENQLAVVSSGPFDDGGSSGGLMRWVRQSPMWKDAKVLAYGDEIGISNWMTANEPKLQVNFYPRYYPMVNFTLASQEEMVNYALKYGEKNSVMQQVLANFLDGQRAQLGDVSDKDQLRDQLVESFNEIYSDIAENIKKDSAGYIHTLRKTVPALAKLSEKDYLDFVEYVQKYSKTEKVISQYVRKDIIDKLEKHYDYEGSAVATSFYELTSKSVRDVQKRINANPELAKEAKDWLYFASSALNLAKVVDREFVDEKNLSMVREISNASWANLFYIGFLLDIGVLKKESEEGKAEYAENDKMDRLFQILNINGGYTTPVTFDEATLATVLQAGVINIGEDTIMFGPSEDGKSMLLRLDDEKQPLLVEGDIPTRRLRKTKEGAHAGYQKNLVEVSKGSSQTIKLKKLGKKATVKFDGEKLTLVIGNTEITLSETEGEEGKTQFSMNKSFQSFERVRGKKDGPLEIERSNDEKVEIYTDASWHTFRGSIDGDTIDIRLKSRLVEGQTYITDELLPSPVTKTVLKYCPSDTGTGYDAHTVTKNGQEFTIVDSRGQPLKEMRPLPKERYPKTSKTALESLENTQQIIFTGGGSVITSIFGNYITEGMLEKMFEKKSQGIPVVFMVKITTDLETKNLDLKEQVDLFDATINQVAKDQGLVLIKEKGTGHVLLVKEAALNSELHEKLDRPIQFSDMFSHVMVPEIEEDGLIWRKFQKERQDMEEKMKDPELQRQIRTGEAKLSKYQPTDLLSIPDDSTLMEIFKDMVVFRVSDFRTNKSGKPQYHPRRTAIFLNDLGNLHGFKGSLENGVYYVGQGGVIEKKVTKGAKKLIGSSLKTEKMSRKVLENDYLEELFSPRTDATVEGKENIEVELVLKDGSKLKTQIGIPKNLDFENFSEGVGEMIARYVYNYIYNELAILGAKKVDVRYLEGGFFQEKILGRLEWRMNGSEDSQPFDTWNLIKRFMELYVNGEEFKVDFVGTKNEAMPVETAAPILPSVRDKIKINKDAIDSSATFWGIDISNDYIKFSKMTNGSVSQVESVSWANAKFNTPKEMVDFIISEMKNQIGEDTEGHAIAIALPEAIQYDTNTVFGRGSKLFANKLGVSRENLDSLDTTYLAQMPQKISEAMNRSNVFVINKNEAEAVSGMVVEKDMVDHNIFIGIGDSLGISFVRDNALIDILGEATNVVIDPSIGALKHSFTQKRGTIQQYLTSDALKRMAKTHLDPNGVKADLIGVFNKTLNEAFENEAVKNRMETYGRSREEFFQLSKLITEVSNYRKRFEENGRLTTDEISSLNEILSKRFIHGDYAAFSRLLNTSMFRDPIDGSSPMVIRSLMTQKDLEVFFRKVDARTKEFNQIFKPLGKKASKELRKALEPYMSKSYTLMIPDEIKKQVPVGLVRSICEDASEAGHFEVMYEEDIDFQYVFKRYGAKDPDAAKVIEMLSQNFIRAVSTLIRVAELDHKKVGDKVNVYISGQLTGFGVGDFLVEQANRYFHQNATIEKYNNVKITVRTIESLDYPELSRASYGAAYYAGSRFAEVNEYKGAITSLLEETFGDKEAMKGASILDIRRFFEEVITACPVNLRGKVAKTLSYAVDQGNGEYEKFTLQVPDIGFFFDLLDKDSLDTFRTLYEHYILEDIYNHLTVFGGRKVLVEGDGLHGLKRERSVVKLIQDAFDLSKVTSPNESGVHKYNPFRLLASYMNMVYELNMSEEDSFVEEISKDDFKSLMEPDRGAPFKFDKTRGKVIGLDIGGSDIKIVGMDGRRVVHEAYIDWEPNTYTSADQHMEKFRELIGGAKDALGGRIEGIGISVNLALNGERITGGGPMTEKLKGADLERIKNLKGAIQKEFDEVPVALLNDGDALALLATQDMSEKMLPGGTLAFAFGTGLAAGYVDEYGRVTGMMNENGNVSVDIFSDEVHSFSKKQGALQQFLSQRPVFRKLEAAERADLVSLPENWSRMGKAEKLVWAQAQIKPDSRANDRVKDIIRNIFSEIGRDLADGIVEINNVLDQKIKNVVLVGRVTKGNAEGEGGAIILESARAALKEKGHIGQNEIRVLYPSVSSSRNEQLDVYDIRDNMKRQYGNDLVEFLKERGQAVGAAYLVNARVQVLQRYKDQLADLARNESSFAEEIALVNEIVKNDELAETITIHFERSDSDTVSYEVKIPSRKVFNDEKLQGMIQAYFLRQVYNGLSLYGAHTVKLDDRELFGLVHGLFREVLGNDEVSKRFEPFLKMKEYLEKTFNAPFKVKLRDEGHSTEAVGTLQGKEFSFRGLSDNVMTAQIDDNVLHIYQGDRKISQIDFDSSIDSIEKATDKIGELIAKSKVPVTGMGLIFPHAVIQGRVIANAEVTKADLNKLKKNLENRFSGIAIEQLNDGDALALSYAYGEQGLGTPQNSLLLQVGAEKVVSGYVNDKGNINGNLNELGNLIINTDPMAPAHRFTGMPGTIQSMLSLNHLLRIARAYGVTDKSSVKEFLESMSDSNSEAFQRVLDTYARNFIDAVKVIRCLCPVENLLIKLDADVFEALPLAVADHIQRQAKETGVELVVDVSNGEKNEAFMARGANIAAQQRVENSLFISERNNERSTSLLNVYPSKSQQVLMIKNLDLTMDSAGQFISDKFQTQDFLYTPLLNSVISELSKDRQFGRLLGDVSKVVVFNQDLVKGDAVAFVRNNHLWLHEKLFTSKTFPVSQLKLGDEADLQFIKAAIKFALIKMDLKENVESFEVETRIGLELLAFTILMKNLMLTGENLNPMYIYLLSGANELDYGRFLADFIDMVRDDKFNIHMSSEDLLALVLDAAGRHFELPKGIENLEDIVSTVFTRYFFGESVFNLIDTPKVQRMFDNKP